MSKINTDVFNQIIHQVTINRLLNLRKGAKSEIIKILRES